jgi:hypothetical protein
VQEEAAATVNKSLLSIDYASPYDYTSWQPKTYDYLSLENLDISDYLQEGDVGFKKPKVSGYPGG